MTRSQLLGCILVMCGCPMLFMFGANWEYSNKVDEISHQDETFLHRRENIEQRCTTSHYRPAQRLFDQNSTLSRFIVDDTNGLLYCFVPKVACTNWKRMLVLLSGKTSYKEPLEIPADRVHRKTTFKFLTEFTPEEVEERLRTYHKFFFVRHPIERLVSAFRNKFEKNFTSSIYFHKHYGIKIIKTYRKEAFDNDLPIDGHGVRFEEFVQYVIDTFKKDPLKLEDHWAPSSQLCMPCQVKFDYIGKYEQIVEDADYILRHIDNGQGYKFPPFIPSGTSGLLDAYVDSLTEDQRRDLMEVYRNDFKLFDYHFRNYL